MSSHLQSGWVTMISTKQQATKQSERASLFRRARLKPQTRTERSWEEPATESAHIQWATSALRVVTKPPKKSLVLAQSTTVAAETSVL